MHDNSNEPEVSPRRDKFSSWISSAATTLLILFLAGDDCVHVMGNSMLLKPDEEIVFKQIGTDSLVLYGYLPTAWHPEASYPAVIFFQEADSEDILFDGYSRYLAMREAVAVVAQYRTPVSHGATPRDSVSDGRDAIRWLRMRADHLGIDPNRIAASGYGPDGYLAAVTGLSAPEDRTAASSDVDSTPHALLLYSTVLTEPSGPWLEVNGWKTPFAMVTEASPPTFTVHRTSGAGRRGVAVRRFCNEMHALGNICEAVEIDKRNSRYLQFRRRESTSHFDVLRRTDRFLTSLGYLEGDPLVRIGDTELLDAWEMFNSLGDRYAPWGSEWHSPPRWDSSRLDAIDPAGRR